MANRRLISEEKIAAHIEQLLTDLNITEPPVPVDIIAQSLGADVRYSAFDGDLSGMLFRDKTQKIIGVNSLHHPNRQRFTIAHEIGHLLLHEGMKDIFVDSEYRVNYRAGEPTNDEKEANNFAAELLMPRRFIMRDIQSRPIDVESDRRIDELSRKYRVSTQAMSIRLSKLAYV